ncbi:MAG: hypothetical protein JXQ73_01625 [Phycisphaerae bacterium]|nr:hypothetical protein [Phycisphaerae bacterium]
MDIDLRKLGPKRFAHEAKRASGVPAENWFDPPDKAIMPGKKMRLDEFARILHKYTPGQERGVVELEVRVRQDALLQPQMTPLYFYGVKDPVYRETRGKSSKFRSQYIWVPFELCLDDIVRVGVTKHDVDAFRAAYLLREADGESDASFFRPTREGPY